MSDADYRTPHKRWTRRNSDMRDTWEGERSAATHDVASEESPLPTERSGDPGSGQQYLTAPEEEGYAERQTHVWGVDHPEV